MKKLLSLLIILSSVFTVSINAREIDMKGRPFDINTLLTSEDILSNVNTQYSPVFMFDSPMGDFSYSLFDPFNTTIQSKFEEVSDLENNTIYNEFYIWNNNPNAFEGVTGSKSRFIVPKFYGDKIIWHPSFFNGPIMEFEEIASPKLVQSTKVGDQLLDRISPSVINRFIPLSGIPGLKITCDKERLELGATAHCKLIFSIDTYSSSEFLSYLNVSANLASDDYEISNIKVGKVAGVKVKDNNVSGVPIDYNKLDRYMDTVESEEEYLELIESLKDDFNYEHVCLEDYPDEETDYNFPRVINQSTLNDLLYGKLSTTSVEKDTEETEPNCYFKTHGNITLVSFDITSNGNSEEGLIKLSDVQIVINTDESGMDPIVVYENEKEETAIPIIGLVKGVEENPKTGLFNYILLIIPVGIFIEGLVLLNKKKIFIKL